MILNLFCGHLCVAIDIYFSLIATFIIQFRLVFLKIAFSSFCRPNVCFSLWLYFVVNSFCLCKEILTESLLRRCFQFALCLVCSYFLISFCTNHVVLSPVFTNPVLNVLSLQSFFHNANSVAIASIAPWVSVKVWWRNTMIPLGCIRAYSSRQCFSCLLLLSILLLVTSVLRRNPRTRPETEW